MVLVWYEYTHSCSSIFFQEIFLDPPANLDHRVDCYIFGGHLTTFSRLHPGSITHLEYSSKLPVFWADFDISSIFLVEFGYDIHDFWWNLGMISMIFGGIWV